MSNCIQQLQPYASTQRAYTHGTACQWLQASLVAWQRWLSGTTETRPPVLQEALQVTHDDNR